MDMILDGYFVLQHNPIFTLLIRLVENLTKKMCVQLKCAVKYVDIFTSYKPNVSSDKNLTKKVLN